MIRFAHPEMLYLLTALPLLLLLFVLSFRAGRRALERFVGRPLFDRLVTAWNPGRFAARAVLALLGLLFVMLALARPQIGTRVETVKRRGVDIMIALDTSLSMAAADMKPDRLTVARAGVQSLIDLLEGDRVGILAFAGVAFVQCPLTLDYAAARMLMEIIDTGIIPQPGTAIGDAINKALTAFVEGENKYKVIVLITDGEDHGTKPEEAARKAAEAGAVIYTVGIGSPDGSPILTSDETGERSYKKDKDGRMVLSRLDETTLRRIADITGGKYYRATAGGGEFRRIYDDISGMEEKELETRRFAQFEERFQYPLALALLCLLVEFLLSPPKREKPEAGP